MDVTETIVGLINKYPMIGSSLAIMGTARFFMKPIRAFVKATPTKVDDELLAKLEESRAWKAASWTLNWLVSIPLPRKK